MKKNKSKKRKSKKLKKSNKIKRKSIQENNITLTEDISIDTLSVKDRLQNILMMDRATI